MRKRTFEDRKFSQGDANSNAYRDSWARMFEPDCSRIDPPTAKQDNPAETSGQTECSDGCYEAKPQGLQPA